MRRAVARDDAVAIVDAHAVVAQRLSEQIGPTTAGFDQDYFGSACVPLFGARRKMQVNVGMLFGNQTDFHADRSAPRFFLEPERFDDPLHARAAMRAARCQY